MTKHLVVLGAMGIGKTTLARLLAERLDRSWRDSDVDIETLFGAPGAEIAAQQSVTVLHELERSVLLGALAHNEPLVIAAAASVVESEMVRRALGVRALTLRLVAPANVVIERQRSGDHRRPMTIAELEELDTRRASFNTEVENLRLEGTAPPHQLVDEVVAWLTAEEDEGP